MIEIINSVITVILTAVMTYSVWALQNFKRHKSIEKEALKMLLKQDLRKLHEEFIEADMISISDYSDFKELYQCYHDLGGNGTGTRMMTDVDKLKTKGE